MEETKYLHIFSGNNIFNEYVYGPEYHEPFVSATFLSDEFSDVRVDYNLRKWFKMLNEPLTFEILSDGKVSWKKTGTATAKTIEYRKNDGEWTSITSTTGGTEINVETGDIVQFRGDNNAYANSAEAFNSFGSTSDFNVYGNIMSLLNKEDFLNTRTLSTNYTFDGLFCDCTTLVSSEWLALPALTLTEGCYRYMFVGCTNMLDTPILPATSIGGWSYSDMFSCCINIQKAPKLPAMELGTYCYFKMFSGCTIEEPPVLPATDLADYCYCYMFTRCANLKYLPELPAKTLKQGCYRWMFNYCNGLTGSIDFIYSGQTLPAECFRGMFAGDINLEHVNGYIQADNFEDSCCYGMFVDCPNLITALDFIGNSNTVMTSASCYNMFCNDGKLIKSPELPATTLGDHCYRQMFYGCFELTEAPSELPATTIGEYCYHAMFMSCSTLQQIDFELPATTLAKGCYRSMFNQCTNLVNPPVLSALTLEEECYMYMFNHTSVNNITCLATDISATDCTFNWAFDLQSSSGTFIKNPNIGVGGTGEWQRGIDGIPYGWTIQDAVI